MLKIFKTHLRKQWIGFVTTALFIMLATVMLTVGISIGTKSKTMLDEKLSANNTANYLTIYGSWVPSFNNTITERFKTNENIKDLNISYELSVETLIKGSNAKDMFPYVIKYEPDKTISKRIPYIEDKSIESGVYINTCYQDKFGVKIGDTLIIKTPLGELERQVKGVYEEYMVLWSPMIMLEAADFDPLITYALTQGNPNPTPPTEGFEFDRNKYIWYAYLAEYNATDATALYKFHNELSETHFIPAVAMEMDCNFNNWNIETTRNQLLGFANILSAMLIVFAFIMTAVSLVIIRFIIVCNMEDDVKNIGILKALGYTTKNLRSIVFSEYLSVGIFAALIGVGLSVPILPVFTNIIGMTVYLIWSAAPTALGLIMGVIVPPLLISSVVWLITMKFKKITPVVALRSGLQGGKFKRNYLPLKRCDRLPSLTLSIKSILNGGKKWLSVGLVMLIVSFFSVFTYMLHYNINVDNTPFVELTSNQPADTVVYTNSEKMRSAVEALDEVEFISYGGYTITNAQFEINEKAADSSYKYYKDFSKTKLGDLYLGKYPENANEVAIAITVANKLNVKIGDTLPIKQMGKIVDFTIVGMCQSMNTTPYTYITGDGYARYGDGVGVEYNELMIFAKKGIKPEALHKRVTEISKGIAFSSREFLEIYTKEENAKMYISDAILKGSEILTYAMDAIAVVAMSVILLFIIRLKLIREKKNIALQKALGVTTFGVMTQVSVGTVIVIAISTLLGGIISALLAEKLLGVALKSYGIMKMSLAVPILGISMIVLGISAFAYIVAMLLSLATKKISPRHLQSN